MTENVDCVVGSGPAGVASAHALLARGRRVLMLDAGLTLSPERERLVAAFRERPDPAAYLASLRALRAALPGEYARVASKLPFASDHVYRRTAELLPAECGNVEVARSLARGGLSTVWGAAALPLPESSMGRWPFARAALAPYYAMLNEIMDVAAPRDDLERYFPNFGTARPPRLAAQAGELMARLVASRTRLAGDGIRFGRARSAVGPRYAMGTADCTHCGFCLYGCPYHVIFDAGDALERLKARPGFEYRAGFLVEGFEEGANGVAIRMRGLADGKSERLACARLFLACGATTTLRLVAAARGWLGREFRMLDSQIFTLPLLLARRVRTAAVPQEHMLAQLFLEIDDPAISDELVHLQLYSFNPFFADLLAERWGRLATAGAAAPFRERLMIALGYLPARLSAAIRVRLEPSRDGGIAMARFAAEPNPASARAIAAVGRKLARHAGALRAFACYPLTVTGAPGGGNHLAGGLPMRTTPGPGECDLLGRPQGLARVHVVDGAVFPDLPATPIAYTIMANAARIATLASDGLGDEG